jgi:hypothetical protein
VSVNFFRVLGVSPALGRAFAPEEVGRHRVAVLSAAIWQAQFRRDPAILGRDIVLNGCAYRVIGIMPPSSFRRTPCSCGSRS